MKKALSIILIAAAAFGFYGGAVDITDILECKDYWEEQGKISDENLDKLEDGVNELEENTDAYLDGKAQYEDGLAQYEEGKAEYEAGLAQIAETEDQYGGEGVPTLKEAKDNVDKLMAAKGSVDKAATIVAANSGGLVTAANAKDIYNNVKKLVAGYSEDEAIATAAKSAGADATQVKQIYEGMKAYVAAGLTPEKAAEKVAESTVLAQLTPILKKAYEGMDAMVACKDDIDKSAAFAASQSLPDGTDEQIAAQAAQIKTVYTSVAGLMTKGLTKDKAIETVAATTVAKTISAQGIAIDAETVGKVVDAVQAYGDNDTALATALGGTIDVTIAKQIAVGYGDAVTSVTKAYEGAALLMGMTVKTAAETIMTNYADTVKQYGDKINTTVIITVYETVKAAVALGAPVDTAIETVAKTLGKSTINEVETSAITAYQGVKMLTDGMSVEQACTTVGAQVGVDGTVIQTVFANISTFMSGLTFDEACAIVANAAGMTTDLIKQAYSGYGEYLEGKATLAAAPAKLADAEAQLADGKSQLAVYEDGMETLKDGLKSLMETKAEGGLKSIADRIGEGEDFLDENGMIDFEKAMFGVEQGRAYSADSSAEITPELTNRAIAAGVGLGAAAFALIAAILGLAKKKKGAGVCGIIAAIAGVVAVFMAKSAGDTWTILAGSTLGATPVIAFGVLAAVALIYAIAEFGAKEA